MIKRTLVFVGLLLSLSANAATLYINEAFNVSNVVGINGELGAVPGSGFYSQSVGFNAYGIARASEVSREPVSNEGLGNTLTYNLTNSPVGQIDVRLQARQSASFVFSDDEPGGDPTGYWNNYMSVGDIDNDENDNFEFLITSGNVYGFSFSVFDNTDKTGEEIIIDLSDGTRETISTSNVYRSWDDGYGHLADQYAFYSSGATIERIYFNEDNGGDDIGLRHFSVSSVQFASPVPVPAATWLFSSALVGLVGLTCKR